MHLNKKLNIGLRLFIGFIVLFLLVRQIEFTQIVKILSNSNLMWVFLSFLIFLLGVIIIAYGLMILFRSSIKIKFTEWIKYFLMTHAVSMVVPGKLGQLSLIYFIRDKGINIGSSTALLIVDKIISVIIFGLIAVVGLFLMSEEIYVNANIILIGCLLLILVGTLFMFSNYSRKLIKFVFGKYKIHFDEFFNTLINLTQNHKSNLIINILITLIRPMFNGLVILLLFRSLGYNVGLIYSTLVSSLTIIASIIPITPNGLGIREGIGVFLFSRINLPLEASLSVYFMILIFNLSLSLIGGVLYFVHNKKLINKKLDQI